MIKQTVSQSSV